MERKDLIYVLLVIVVGVYALFKLKDFISDAVKGFGGFIGDIGKGVGDVAVGIVGGIGGFIGRGIEGIKNVIGNIIGGVAGSIGYTVGGAIKTIENVIAVPFEFMSNIKDTISKGLENLIVGTTKTIEGVVTTPFKTINDLVNNINQTLQGLGGFTSGAINNVKGIGDNAIKTINDLLANSVKVGSDVNANVVEVGANIANTVKNVVDEVAKTATNLFTSGANVGAEAVAALGGYSGYTEKMSELTTRPAVLRDVVGEAGKQLQEGKINILDFIKIVQGEKEITSVDTSDKIDYSSVCLPETEYGMCLAERTESSDAYIPTYKSPLQEQPSPTQVVGPYGEIYNVVDVYGRPMGYVETPENRAQWEPVPLPWRWWEE